MFNSSKIIVVITSKKIKAFVVKLGVPSPVEKYEEFDWTSATIAEVLQTIKKTFGTSVRILFSDEFVYVTTLKTDNPQSIKRDAIQSLAQEFIPEDMNKTSWDYRIYPPEHIQVAVLNTSIYDQITEAVQKSAIDIEAIESCSSSLGRLIAYEKEPLILVYQDDVPVIITIQNGVALTSAVIHEGLTGTHIEQAIRFSQDQFQITIKKIIRTEKIGSLFTSEFFKDIVIESKSLEPAVGLAMKTDVKTPDADSLNLKIDSPSVKNNPRISFLPYILFFCAFIFTLSGVYFGQKYFLKKKNNIPTITPTRTPTKVPTPKPNIVIKKEYTVRILNGSKVSSETLKLKNILTEKKYVIASTDTAVEAKPGISLYYGSTVDRLYLNELDKLLKTIYTTVDTEQKLASDEADITIIIGTFTKKKP